MFRVSLVNMPFAALTTPSLALTQLRSVLRSMFGDRVSVEILYLNHELARVIGLELYDRIASSVDGQNSGLGEWFFRQAAFPGQADNAEEYLGRYYPRRDPDREALKRSILERRVAAAAALAESVERHGLDRAQVVGLTSVFFQNTASLALARAVKLCSPEVVTVMGGANCEWPMGEVLARSVEHVDYVVSGPGLRSFPQLVGRLLDGEAGLGEPIAGVHAAGAGRWSDPALRLGEELDIDAPVELDYDDFLDTFEMTFPEGGATPHLLFETSRGCWWGERSQCTFCGLNGLTMQHRAMSPDRAVELIQHLFRYSPRCRYFEAVDNLLPKSYVADVLPRLRTPANATVFYEVKANLTPDEVEALARAGVRRVQPGIESLATSTLRLMRKGTTAFTNLRFLASCAEHGVEPAWNLLVGFPGEAEEVYEKYERDLPLLRHLPPPMGVFPVRFDRYSPYFAEVESFGLDLRPYDFYGLVYPWPDEVLADLAYYFMDHAFEADYQAAMIRWIDRLRAAVGSWQTMWAGRDRTAAPELRFVSDRPGLILDSRSGAPVEHEVGEHGQAVLALLDGPKPASTIARRLGGLPGFDAEATLRRLAELGLVFQEGDRYLSLVLAAGGGRLAREAVRSPEITGSNGTGCEAGPVLKRVRRDAFRVRRSAVSGAARRERGEDE